MTSKGIFSKATCSQHFPYKLFVASVRDFCKFCGSNQALTEIAISEEQHPCSFRQPSCTYPGDSRGQGRGPEPALAAHAAHRAGKLHLSSPKPSGAPPGTHSSWLCPPGCVSTKGMPTSFFLSSLNEQHRAKMGGKGDLGQWMEKKIAKMTYAKNSQDFTLL